MKLSLQALAELVEGRLEGDPTAEVSRFSPIEEAGPGDLTFLSNPKYQPYLAQTQATAVLVPQALSLQEAPAAALIRVRDVYATFTQLLTYYQEQTAPPPRRGREEPCFVAASATVAEDAYIGAFAYVGEHCRIEAGAQVHPHCYLGEGVAIGEGSVLYSGARLYPRTQVGRRCIVHSGAVLGSDGFGFAPQEGGAYAKTPQLGHVVLEDEVEIGANTTIDRATLKSTVIEQGVKLDNLVQIAHNVRIGAHTVIAAQTGVSGSTQLGARCTIGGQVGFAGHIHIADGSRFGAQSGIAHSVKEPHKTWLGSPALPIGESRRIIAAMRSLPELLKKVRSLEKQLRDLFPSS
jgi:UDP-3-O-[3-hydroxymyristoyl] glucosamine N-acyltransferase